MHRRRSVPLVVLAIAGILVGGGGHADARPSRSATLDRLAAVIESDGASSAPAVSTDGRYVAFVSSADNLLGGEPSADPNHLDDVFLVDTQAGAIRLVSKQPGTGVPANGASTGVDISGDGRYVAFSSDASNLVASDTNETSDVFRYDAQTGAIDLASRKGLTGAQGNKGSDTPSISKDGSLVAFMSRATNLVNNDSNNTVDVFVRDVVASTTTRASTDSKGKQSNGDAFEAQIAPNGSVVAWSTTATNLVNSDPSRTRDVYVKVLDSGKTSIASVRSDEVRGTSDSTLEDLSSSGRYVLMQSYSALVKNDTNNTGDVFLRDRTGGTTVRVSRDGSEQANDQSYGGAISDDGAWVVFQTWSTNLVPGPDGNGLLPDVLQYRVSNGDLTRISADTEGGWLDHASSSSAMSGDGLRICYVSAATDAVAGDTNDLDDVFCHAWNDATRTSSTVDRWSVGLPAA